MFMNLGRAGRSNSGAGFRRKEAGTVRTNALIIHERDNVAVVMEDIPKGGRVLLSSGEELKALEDIPCSHKVALVDLVRGQEIIKYGEVIGRAKEDIKRGSWIHTHNLVVEE